jgi:Set1/Ash2 histone methyltransferase complex subunit ASH2
MSSERSLTPPPSSSFNAATNRKRVRGLMDTDPLLHAAFTAIAQFCTQHNYHATASSLQQQGIIPTEDQLLVWVPKALHDRPPWVHWNKADMAPQLKCPDVARCSVTPTVVRGYRMARASQAAESGGAYYYEVLMQPGPSAKEIAAGLPPWARLGPGLREQLEAALHAEEQQQEGDNEAENKTLCAVGGHIRLGWSMRTGDLQAPVGYDKWSYGVRDQGGSILHRSQRQDDWGGEGFGPGDLVGCALFLTANGGSDNDEEEGSANISTREDANHIRFFKNGTCMGTFILTKGKRIGGEAFTDLDDGVYYPAVSLYLGGSVRANFGPHFVYPPKKLPAGLTKQLRPLSEACPVPMAPTEAVQALQTVIKPYLHHLTQDQVQAIRHAIQVEADMVVRAYETFHQNQLKWVRQEREKRGISIHDLPELAEGDSIERGEEESVTEKSSVAADNIVNEGQ